MPTPVDPATLPPRQRWYVCDMDDGVLRVEASRTAAVDWALRHTGAVRVYARHTYGPGSYSYAVGSAADDLTSFDVVRGDRLEATGYASALPAGVRFPHPSRPHDYAEEG